jgi:hypothetical protein
MKHGMDPSFKCQAAARSVLKSQQQAEQQASQAVKAEQVNQSTVKNCFRACQARAQERGQRPVLRPGSEVVSCCLFGSRLDCHVWECLEPVLCECVLCGLRVFVFGLAAGAATRPATVPAQERASASTNASEPRGVPAARYPAG